VELAERGGKADWVCRRQGRLRPVARGATLWQAGRGVRRRRRATGWRDRARPGRVTGPTVRWRTVGRGPHGATQGQAFGRRKKRSMLLEGPRT